MSRIVVGVMGPGEAASPADCAAAERLGQLFAQRGWVTLTGGRAHGVMEAALRGAHAAGGLTLGVLPQDNPQQASGFADIRILTGMGEARNAINVLSSQVVFVCGMSVGTASEVALALKTKRHTILVGATTETARFWELLGSTYLHSCASPDEAVTIAAGLLP